MSSEPTPFAWHWEKRTPQGAHLISGLTMSGGVAERHRSNGAIVTPLFAQRTSPVDYPENPRPWTIDGEHVRDATGQIMVSFDPDDDDGFWPFIVAAVNVGAPSGKAD